MSNKIVYSKYVERKVINLILESDKNRGGHNDK